MYNKYNIMNIEGILCYKDIPIIDFKIGNMRLLYARDLSKGKYYPYHMEVLGLTYVAFNSFFNDRVVRDHTQDIRDYLDFLHLPHYDFNEMVKRANGWDALGFWWVKFSNMGAKCWDELVSQKYPIYG